jgi:hypothetical protein
MPCQKQPARDGMLASDGRVTCSTILTDADATCTTAGQECDSRATLTRVACRGWPKPRSEQAMTSPTTSCQNNMPHISTTHRQCSQAAAVHSTHLAQRRRRVEGEHWHEGSAVDPSMHQHQHHRSGQRTTHARAGEAHARTPACLKLLQNQRQEPARGQQQPGPVS